jgi:CDP-diacylglycerol--glycerol-3-phosphate 3-phosphatidyltransferase
MITLSNSLSFSRAPLAFLFLQENPSLRLLAIFLAMLTDSIDGYLARRYQSTSQFGAMLDPIMDKFFVYFALGTLFFEGKIVSWEIATMLSRDFFLCLYAILMIARGKWKAIVFRSVRWGKITTALQFIVLIGLVSGISFPWIAFASFIAMGWLAFLELFFLTDTPSLIKER